MLIRRSYPRLLRGGLLVLSGNVLTTAMNLAAVIVTIRHLSVEAFGMLTLTLTTMQLIAMLSNAGLNETLMTMVSRAEAAQQRHEVVATLSAILRLRLLMTSVVAAGGFLLAGTV